MNWIIQNYNFMRVTYSPFTPIAYFDINIYWNTASIGNIEGEVTKILLSRCCFLIICDNSLRCTKWCSPRAEKFVFVSGCVYINNTTKRAFYYVEKTTLGSFTVLVSWSSSFHSLHMLVGIFHSCDNHLACTQTHAFLFYVSIVLAVIFG